MPHHPIGIATHGQELFVVCNDGAVYILERDSRRWRQLHPVPETERDSAGRFRESAEGDQEPPVPTTSGVGARSGKSRNRSRGAKNL